MRVSFGEIQRDTFFATVCGIIRGASIRPAIVVSCIAADRRPVDPTLKNEFDWQMHGGFQQPDKLHRIFIICGVGVLRIMTTPNDNAEWYALPRKNLLYFAKIIAHVNLWMNVQVVEVNI